MILLLVWAAKLEVSSLECDGFCILMMGRMRGKIVIVAIQKVEVAVMTDVSAKKQFTMVNCCMVVLKWKIMVTPWSIALPPQIIRFALPKNTFFCIEGRSDAVRPSDVEPGMVFCDGEDVLSVDR